MTKTTNHQVLQDTYRILLDNKKDYKKTCEHLGLKRATLNARLHKYRKENNITPYEDEHNVMGKNTIDRVIDDITEIVVHKLVHTSDATIKAII